MGSPSVVEVGTSVGGSGQTNIYNNYRFLSRRFGGRVSLVHGYFGGYIVRNLFLLMVYHDREVGIPSAALGVPNWMDEREGWDHTYSGLGI